MTRNKKYILSFTSILFLSIIIAILFCYPFSNGILHKGADTGFHLSRIQAYRDAIVEGIKYPYIYWHMNFDFGYPTPLFYCQLFLYPCVFLTSKGISLIVSYKIYICALIFAATFFIGINLYVVSKKKLIPAIIAMLIYIPNIHQITSIFRRSALGELTALVFIPVAILGIYYTLYEDENKWIVLTIGYTGLALSHNITFYLMCILFGIFFLINIKHINKNRVFSTIKGILFAFLLSAFFLLPMVEAMFNNNLQVNDSFNSVSIMQGLKIVELFNFSADFSLYQSSSIGPFLLFLPLTSLFIKNKKRDNKFIFDCLIIGYVTLFIMTEYFPWQLFKFMNFMQFTNRLLVIIIPLLAISGAYYTSIFIDNFKNSFLKYFILSVTCLIIIVITAFALSPNLTGVYGYTDNMSLEEAYEVLYKPYENETYYDSQALSSGDYLPVAKTNYINYPYETPAFSKSHSIIDTSEEMKIDPNGFEMYEYYHYKFNILSNSHDNAYVIVPKTYYNGYKVDIIKNGSIIETIDPVQDKISGNVKFNVYKSDETITYDVYYQETKIQTYSMFVSKISFIIFLIVCFYEIFKKKSFSNF